jgi:energy-converting hydrogenase Eha subunit B
MIQDILDNISPKTLLAGIVVTYTLVRTVQWLDEERRIRALGGHARKVRTYLPFGKSS